MTSVPCRSLRGLATLIAILGFLSTSLTAQKPLHKDASLVAWYAFEDAVDSAVTSDDSGNRLTAVLHGGAKLDSRTRDGVGGALRCGPAGSAAIPPAFDVGGSGLTVSAWFQADSFPGASQERTLISKASGARVHEHIFQLGTVRSGNAVRLRARVRVNGRTTTLVATSGSLRTGVWSHAALTYDGTQLQLYLDGVSVGRTRLSGNVDLDPRAGVALGNEPPGAGDQPFDGLLDDARVYGRALTSAEIRTIAKTRNDIHRVVRRAVPLPPLVGVPILAATASAISSDTTPPTVPSNIKGAARTTTSVELAWTESFDASGVEYYIVRRDGVEIAPPKRPFFLDTGATPDTTHTYDVFAVDMRGNVSTTPATVQVTTPAPPGDPTLLANYGFEEGAGTVILDSTGNSNDGTLAGAIRGAGFFGAGIRNDGASGSVDLGTLDVVGPGLTLAMWVRPEGFGVPDGRMISKASGFDNDSHVWMVSRVNGNQLRFRLRTDAGPTQTLIAPAGSLVLGEWTHVAVTYDGAFMRIFQDGVELDSLAWTGSVAVDPAVAVAIGDQPGGGKNFHGDLDEVWIYGRALSSTEITDLMGTPITDPAPDTTSPTAPDQVVAYGISTSRIDLHWTESEDDDQVALYRVLRDGVEAGTTTGLTFRDTGLVASTTHNYTVLAEDAAGNLSPSTATAMQTTLANDQDEWFDISWNYRVPVVVGAQGHARIDRLADFEIDFTALALGVGASGSLDPGSIRVIEVNAAGQILDAAVPFQFDPGATFDAGTNAVGRLAFLCDGWLPATASRYFHVYFDLDTTRTAPTFTDRVSVVDGVMDQGQTSFEVTTSLGTYLYHKDGGGFSSLLDLDGNDWIDYRPTGGASGNFRGIPNLSFPEGHFHPGATTSTSTLIRQGPLAIGIHSITMDGWECTWDIYPNHARLTVLGSSHPYWFLYEGTPGGALEPGVDQLIRANGAIVNTGTDDRGDILGDEWAYFVDPNVGRGLFFANHNDDPHHDTYFPLQGVMTVFGFGRENIASLNTQIPATFTIGFLENPDFEPASERVRQFFNELDLGLGSSVVVGGVGTAPTVATNVLTTAQSTTEVQVSWGASSDNVGIDGYRVLRDGIEVAFVSGTIFLDSGLQGSTTYTYEVVAIDVQGMTAAPSLPAQATTL
ncbi:MAG: LamG-like jellyroll fold domain-containing protein [Planctomycetota bacterium]